MPVPFRVVLLVLAVFAVLGILMTRMLRYSSYETQMTAFLVWFFAFAITSVLLELKWRWKGEGS